MTKDTIETYRTLRRVWGATASQALSMARARHNLDIAGAEFIWEHEQENPVDVFGELDPVDGPFYDPDAEFLCCLVKSADGAVLDSLGMIDGAFEYSYGDSRNYGWLVECEMAAEAWERMTDIVRDYEATLA